MVVRFMNLSCIISRHRIFLEFIKRISNDLYVLKCLLFMYYSRLPSNIRYYQIGIGLFKEYQCSSHLASYFQLTLSFQESDLF